MYPLMPLADCIQRAGGGWIMYSTGHTLGAMLISRAIAPRANTNYGILCPRIFQKGLARGKSLP